MHRPVPIMVSRSLARIDSHDGLEKLYGLRLRPLERIAPDDGAKPAAVTNRTRLIKHLRVLALGASREYHDPAPIERALHHMLDALRQCGDRNLSRFVHLLRRTLFKMRRGKLDLNDM